MCSSVEKISDGILGLRVQLWSGWPIRTDVCKRKIKDPLWHFVSVAHMTFLIISPSDYVYV